MKEKLKVLVVDDDRRMVRTIFDTGLKMPGINGVEALHLIKTASPRREML